MKVNLKLKEIFESVLRLNIVSLTFKRMNLEGTKSGLKVHQDSAERQYNLILCVHFTVASFHISSSFLCKSRGWICGSQSVHIKSELHFEVVMCRSLYKRKNKLVSFTLSVHSQALLGRSWGLLEMWKKGSCSAVCESRLLFTRLQLLLQPSYQVST